MYYYDLFGLLWKELYFTVECNDKDCSRVVYISDKNGNRLTKYDDYQYKYKPDTAELETIDRLIKAEQKFTLQKGEELSDDIHEANIVLNGKNPSYGLVDKERHRNRRLFGLHGVGNQNRKNMN